MTNRKSKMFNKKISKRSFNKMQMFCNKNQNRINALRCLIVNIYVFFKASYSVTHKQHQIY